MADQPINTTSADGQSSVNSAIKKDDPVQNAILGAIGGAVNAVGGSGKSSGASAASAALAGADPTLAYVQAGSAAIQGLSTLANGDKSGPVGGANVFTPNNTNGPTAIINFGSGSLSGSGTTSPMISTSPSTASATENNGSVSGIIKYAFLAVVGLIALKMVTRKAA